MVQYGPYLRIIYPYLSQIVIFHGTLLLMYIYIIVYIYICITHIWMIMWHNLLLIYPYLPIYNSRFKTPFTGGITAWWKPSRCTRLADAIRSHVQASPRAEAACAPWQMLCSGFLRFLRFLLWSNMSHHVPPLFPIWTSFFKMDNMGTGPGQTTAWKNMKKIPLVLPDEKATRKARCGEHWWALPTKGTGPKNVNSLAPITFKYWTQNKEIGDPGSSAHFPRFSAHFLGRSAHFNCTKEPDSLQSSELTVEF